MKLSIYDRKLSEIIKLLRQVRHVKQTHIANALFINQSTYSRMENGEIPFSPGQVHQIALELKTTTFQIYAIVESDLNNEHYPTTLSQMLSNFISYTKSSKNNLNEEEVENILRLIKSKN